jgi:hypothetical protein
MTLDAEERDLMALLHIDTVDARKLQLIIRRIARKEIDDHVRSGAIK